MDETLPRISSISEMARQHPEKTASVIADLGTTINFVELERASVQLARLLRDRGLEDGDRVALLLQNSNEYLVAYWAAIRAGLRAVPINWHLTDGEAGYIIADSDARIIITDSALADLAARSLAPDQVVARFVFGGSVEGFESIEKAAADYPDGPPDDERAGSVMAYSSGTTGQPKGIMLPLTGAPFKEPPALDRGQRALYGMDESTVFLAPSPMYHAAPLWWLMATQRFGGTAVSLQRFDAEEVLKAIERHRVTHAQFVPTHFIRLLRLPPEVRSRYDLSSLKLVMHAAAPCSVEVKRQMMEWWGPIIHEYYSGSEGAGYTAIGPDEWLAHPGSVGRAQWGAIHVLDDNGLPVVPGTVGQIYFEDARPFEYHKAAGQTKDFFNDRGWGTLGDMGWLDDAGYLYLADRKSHMIISGGVNIYPQEIEDAMVLHPAVQDVAVIGIPDPEFGEKVMAVVCLAAGYGPSDDIIAILDRHCRERLAGYKCPRTWDFAATLPRTPVGKLLKRELRKQYWPAERALI